MSVSDDLFLEILHFIAAAELLIILKFLSLAGLSLIKVAMCG